MASISVDTSSVSTSSNTVMRIAQNLSNLTTGRSLSHISDCLPGSSTAESATNAGTISDKKREELQQSLCAFSEALATSATNYTNTETTNSDAFVPSLLMG